MVISKRALSRSKSRATKNQGKILASRNTSPPPPAYRLSTTDCAAAKAKLWTEVTKVTRTPKIVAITSRNGSVVLKPQEKESNDVLKKLMKTNPDLKQDLARWPRVIIPNIDSDLTPLDIVTSIAEQNPALELNSTTCQEKLKPVFKRGPRDRPTVSWILDVEPSFYQTVLKEPLYIGFSRTTPRKFDEITQCLKCLGFGHPASKCFQTTNSCSHFAAKGHLSEACSRLSSMSARSIQCLLA